MTVSETIMRLQQFENEGMGDLPLTITFSDQRCELENINVQGSGIISSAEYIAMTFDWLNG